MQEQPSQAGGLDQKIDASQIKLRGLEQQMDVEGLAKKIKQYDGTFFDQVNLYQDMDKTFQITSKEARKHFDKGKNEIDLYLRTIAASGKAWFETRKPTMDKTKDVAKKPSSNDIRAMAEVIEAQAKDLQKTLQKYRDHMVVIGKMEEIKTSADESYDKVLQIEKTFEKFSADPDILLKACDEALIGKDGDAGCIGLKNMLQSHTELPEAYRAEIDKLLEKRLPELAENKSRAVQLTLIHAKYADTLTLELQSGRWKISFTEKGNQLSDDEKQKILAEMARASLEVEENLEAATAPEYTQKFWAGKELFEQGNIVVAQKLLKEFKEKDASKMDADKKLASKKVDYLARTDEMLKKIDKQLDNNKDIYDAQMLIEAGETAKAKTLLKKWLNENTFGPYASVEIANQKTAYRKIAETWLQKIALAQLASVEEKFKSIKPLSSPELAEHKYGSGPGSKKEYADMLQKIRDGITGGKYLDFADAYNAESLKLTYPVDKYFNCLTDVFEEEKGKSGLLALARKYRELGRRDLAEEYFQRYFAEKLNVTAQKSDQIPARGIFEKQMRNNYKFIVREEDAWKKSRPQLEEQYQKKTASDPQWVELNPLEQYLKRSRAESAKQLIDGAYQDLVIREQNHQYIKAPANLGDIQDQTAWSEYMNMKGYHGQEKWWSPVSLSDEMAEELTKNLVIDIAIIAASAGLGGVAAGAVKEAITAARFSKLATALEEVGTLSQLGRAAKLADIGISSNLAGVNAFATESTVFFLGDKALRNVIYKEEFKTSAEEFLISTMQLGGFQALGKVTHTLGIGKASKALEKATQLGGQLAFQGATAGGELTLKDLAFVAGLEIVHGRKGEKKTAAEKAMEKAKAKETAEDVRVQAEQKTRVAEVAFATLYDDVGVYSGIDKRVHNIDQVLEFINRVTLPQTSEWGKFYDFHDDRGVIMRDPQGKLHLFKDHTSEYDFRDKSFQFKAKIRKLNKLASPGERPQAFSDLLNEIDFSKIDPRDKQALLSKAGPEISKLIEQPDINSFKDITPENFQKLKVLLLSLKNQELRNLRILAREKTRITIDFATRAEEILRKEVSKKRRLTRDEFYKMFDFENDPEIQKAGFTDEEKLKIHYVIDGLFSKGNAIQSYHDEFSSTPEKLYEMAFGQPPLGKVKLSKVDFALAFECADSRDYTFASEGHHSTQHTAIGLALPFGRSRIEALDGFLVVINSKRLADSKNTTLDETLKHEERHNINKFVFRALHPALSYFAPELTLKPDSTLESKKLSVGAYIQKETKTNLLFAKDEILAFRKGGSDFDYIRMCLVKRQPGQSYYYWDHVDNQINKSISKIPNEKERSQMESFLVEAMLDAEDNYNARLDRAIEAAQKIDDINLLAITDIDHWQYLATSMKPKAE